mmetsp:Transcript_17059/g.46096  ORF Transcript_17059/g.46096 Transcript_17059/m.46096 type:complete len:237 (+) Transcript_17059:139-849(+)
MVAAAPLLIAALHAFAPGPAPHLARSHVVRPAFAASGLRMALTSMPPSTGPALPTKGTQVMPEDYRLALVCLLPGMDIMLRYHESAGFVGGFVMFALGLIFAVQTMRVRFVCTPSSFTIMKKPMSAPFHDNSLAVLADQGNNVVVGGKNQWKYKDFVNYEFFPKGCAEAGLPCVLIYFKETATSQKDARGPGKLLSDLSLKFFDDAVPGQVHFAPAMCDPRELGQQFAARGAKKIR